MTTNIAIFVLAAFFEIAGCFAFWMSLRRGATPLLAVLGVVSLIAFAFALTRVDSAFAGRAYAAYGGIYIAASLVWLWVDLPSLAHRIAVSERAIFRRLTQFPRRARLAGP